jgi:hypothetical protein
VASLARIEASQAKQFDELRAEIRNLKKDEGADVKKPGKRRDKDREAKEKPENEPDAFDSMQNSPSLEFSQMVTLLHTTNVITPQKLNPKTPKKSDQNDATPSSPSSEGMSDAVLARKSDPKLLKKSDIAKREKDSILVLDLADETNNFGKSPRRKNNKRGNTIKLSGEIHDEVSDDAVDERELEESAIAHNADLSVNRNQRSLSGSFIPPMETKHFESFIDDDDITISEDEAFQQAWVELENQRQRKITSLGPKDIEKILAITNQKLKEQRHIGSEIKASESPEKRKAVLPFLCLHVQNSLLVVEAQAEIYGDCKVQRTSYSG